MADPQIDNVVRAQCIWKGPSNLPTDRYVTTWAFVRSSSGVKNAGAQSGEVANRLLEFWNEPPEGESSVASFIPANIRANGLEIRTYDLGQPTSEGNERIPTIYNFPSEGANAAPPLPREVAVTLSFFAEVNRPRKRGRVYVGPLTTAAMSSNENGTVSAALQGALRASALRLSTWGMGLGDEMVWGVLSQMDDEINVVTAGWIDNAFDTIRSRGQDPSSRVTFKEP
jgi:hypothetical protein